LFLKEGKSEIPWDNRGLQEMEYSLEENTTASVTLQQGSIALGLFGIFFLFCLTLIFTVNINVFSINKADREMDRLGNAMKL